MSKTSSTSELINLLVKSLRHKIGGIVNSNEIYAQKYSKDAEVLFREAEKVCKKENWNNYDKERIKNELKENLLIELKKCDFLDDGKFDILDEEIMAALRSLSLD
jgi:hypothetical protein